MIGGISQTNVSTKAGLLRTKKKGVKKVFWTQVTKLDIVQISENIYMR
jgi:hypothetical protein